MIEVANTLIDVSVCVTVAVCFRGRWLGVYVRMCVCV